MIMIIAWVWRTGMEQGREEIIAIYIDRPTTIERQRNILYGSNHGGGEDQDVRLSRRSIEKPPATTADDKE